MKAHEIERRFLGVMIDDHAGDSRYFGLDADVTDFTSEPRRDIWRVITALADIRHSDPFVKVTPMKMALDAEQILERRPADGLVIEISEVVDAWGARPSEHITDLMRALKAATRARNVDQIVGQIQDASRENPLALVGHVDELREKLEAEVVKDETRGRMASRTVSETLANLALGEKAPPLSLGMMARDFSLGRGTLTVLAGPRKAGKTLLLLNRILTLAESHTATLFFSIEMTQEQLDARIAGFLTGTDYRRFEYGTATPDEIATARECVRAATWLDNAIIDCRKIHTLDSIEGTIRLWQLKRPDLSLVAIDYDGLIEMPRGRGQSMAEAADVLYRGLAMMAKRLNIALLVLAQLRNEAVSQLSPDADAVYGGVNPAAKSDAVLVLNCPEDAGFAPQAYRPHFDETLLRLRVAIQRSGPSRVATWVTLRAGNLEVAELEADVRRGLEEEMRGARQKAPAVGHRT